MPKKITKAIITAGGFGSRMLPISKAVPKEMLPIVDKPGIQYLAEEACAAGITDILIITGRDKEAIEDYFDFAPEYEQALKNKGGEKDMKKLGTIRAVPNIANFHFIRQKEPKGLGHAVFCARSFIGDDDFIVMYSDDIIIGDPPAAKQLIDVYEKYGGDISVAAVREVEREKLRAYCSLDVELIEDGEYYVYDMNEKPQTDAEIFSDFAILGRVLLTPEIFEILKTQPPGANNEIQLTDAMKTLTKSAKPGAAKMIAKTFAGERHDMGSKLGFLRANVMEGLKHPETGVEFRKFLRGLTL